MMEIITITSLADRDPGYCYTGGNGSNGVLCDQVIEKLSKRDT